MYPPHPPPTTKDPKQQAASPPASRHSRARLALPELSCLSLSPAGATPGLRVTGRLCPRDDVIGCQGCCSEARQTGSCVCGCTAWLQCDSPDPPLDPLRLNLGIFAAVLVLVTLRTAQSPSLSPAWLSFLGEGADFSGDSGSSPRVPTRGSDASPSASRDQVPNVVLKF